MWETGFQLADGEEFDGSVRGGLNLACLGRHFCFSHGREGPFVTAKADTPLRRIGKLPDNVIADLLDKAREPTRRFNDRFNKMVRRDLGDVHDQINEFLHGKPPAATLPPSSAAASKRPRVPPEGAQPEMPDAKRGKTEDDDSHEGKYDDTEMPDANKEYESPMPWTKVGRIPPDVYAAIEQWHTYKTVREDAASQPDEYHEAHRTAADVKLPSNMYPCWARMDPSDTDVWTCVQSFVDNCGPGLQLQALSAMYFLPGKVDWHVDEMPPNNMCMGDADIFTFNMGEVEYNLHLRFPDADSTPLGKLPMLPKGFARLSRMARKKMEHAVLEGPQRFVVRASCSHTVVAVDGEQECARELLHMAASAQPRAANGGEKDSEVAKSKRVTRSRSHAANASIVAPYISHLQKEGAAYFLHAPDKKFLSNFKKDLEDAHVLTYNDAGGCTNERRGTVGRRRGVLSESFRNGVLAIVREHKHKFHAWGHDPRLEKYVRKLAIKAPGMKDFPAMHGKSEETTRAELAKRKRDVLDTTTDDALANLVNCCYKIVDDIRPAHLASLPGASTRYPITIGVGGTHVVSHSDEPTFDGPGAGIYNFVICGRGLVGLSSIHHADEPFRVFEAAPGDVWFIADEFRVEWEHEVLRDMPRPQKVDFDTLDGARVVITVRQGEVTDEQVARWFEVYGDQYDDSDEPTTEPRKTTPKAATPKSKVSKVSKSKQSREQSRPKEPKPLSYQPGAKTTWIAGVKVKKRKQITFPSNFTELASLTKKTSGHTSTIAAGANLTLAGGVTGTVLMTGMIFFSNQPNYVCIVHIGSPDDCVRVALAAWVLECLDVGSASSPGLTARQTTRLQRWLQTEEAQVRLSKQPLRSDKKWFAQSGDIPDVVATMAGGARRPHVIEDLPMVSQAVASSLPRQIGGVFERGGGSNLKPGAGGMDFLVNTIQSMTEGLTSISSTLRNVDGSVSAPELLQRREMEEAKRESERQAMEARLLSERQEMEARLEAKERAHQERESAMAAQHFQLTQTVLSQLMAAKGGAPTPVPESSPPATESTDVMMAELKKLKKMFDDELIDADDYKHMKQNLVGRYMKH